jgi:hypothetical protein
VYSAVGRVPSGLCFVVRPCTNDAYLSFLHPLIFDDVVILVLEAQSFKTGGKAERFVQCRRFPLEHT